MDCLSKCFRLFIFIFVGMNEIIGRPENYIQNRIVGGNRVKYREEFAYQVSIRSNGYHICGGTIYKPHYIITAAHCLVGAKAHQLEVVAGDLHLTTTTSKTQKIKVNYFTIHDNYSDITHNDVGIIRLKKDLKFNNYVRNATIWNETLHSLPNQNTQTHNCVVSGWGSTYSGGPVVKDLTFVNVTLFSKQKCKYIYTDSFIESQMVCAGDEYESKDACTGDSGGPLMCHGYLYGIVSWGVGCGIPYNPGVYTNASYYADWINAHTNMSNLLMPINKYWLFVIYYLLVL